MSESRAVEPGFAPHRPYLPAADPLTEARRFHETMKQRRSVRMFSDRPVPREVIESVVAAAGTAPSGANKQPWRFVAVRDPAVKREIRLAAEREEHEFYHHRASDRWLQDLHPFGTDERKPFLEVAPWLVVIFRLSRTDDEGQVYYVNESVGIATGMFLTACHLAGLATLTHTPSPMKFLARILRRPEYERPYLLIPVGYPAEDCIVPDIERKPLEEILVFDRPDHAAADDGTTPAADSRPASSECRPT